jgi:PAS domain S-box-containing protein
MSAQHLPAAPEELELTATLAVLEAAVGDARLALRRLHREVGEQRAVKAELDLRTCALDALTTCIAIVDIRLPQRPFVFLNQAFAAMLGGAPDTLLGASYDRLPLAAGSEDASAAMREAMANGRDWRGEMRMCRSDGSEYWVGMTLTPVRGADDALSHYVAIGADITARLEADRRKQELQERLLAEMKERERMAIELRLAQKLESVGRLAAGVAHEINTPIQYVGDSIHFLRAAAADCETLIRQYRSAIDALAGGAAAAPVLEAVRAAEAQADLAFLAEEVPKAFERTLDGVDRVAGIVRAMKEFAHPDPTEQSPADINHAIETTLTVARNEYKYVASVHTDLGSLPAVTCNIGEINQVLLNLLVNAAHAIEAARRPVGEGRIEIATRSDGAHAVVAVRDNGCGIAPEHLDHIFDPFFTTKEVGKGTGQGLAIARSIVVDKHGGDIQVRSVPGEGTEFTLRLPVGGCARREAA